MKKVEQEKINEICEKAYDQFDGEFWLENPAIHHFEQLRSCKAYVHFTENYIYLISYITIVAFIDCRTNTFYDVLRYVYGYTATSAQHISKFKHDFSGHFNTSYCYR